MSSLLLAAAAAAAAALDTPICADRPAKANAVCTVPAGHFQLEVGAIDWAQIKEGGETVEATALGSSLLKVGVDDRSDVELNITPYVRITGDAGKASGFGDILVRYKYRLSDDDAPVQLALLPFVKFPTAKHDIGDGKLEGGLAIPVSFSLGGAVSATLGPEVDLLADVDGHGRHAALVNVLNISAAVTPRLTIGGELWSSFNFDPAETVSQASADAAIAYVIGNDVQLDAGANFGLTRETPDLEFYGGISARF
ncbi:transporter [Sphingomonas alba]|uniref:Transporter n=1 Tax=Sphingomonas alba TaxID=2908208 RepID=A0ABT0RLW0_9SPHN|nr:transporter [Sphingomonas alba]MCL6683548.1 transporter [Sphingomonas alba]